MKNGFILILILSFFGQNIAQSDFIYSNYISNGTVINKDKIVIDFNTDYYEPILQEFDGIEFINHLCIKNEPKRFIHLNKIDRINNLELVNISESRFNSIINTISKDNDFNKLILNDIHLEEFPYKLEHLKINELILENCDGIKINDFLKAFDDENEIRKIRIINSQLVDVSVSHLNNLEVLDLRNNQLSNLPVSLNNIKSLDSLYLSGNYMPNLKNELIKLSKSSLKFIEIDKISEEDLNYLRNELSSKTIVCKNEIVEDKKGDNLKYGELTTSTKKTKILSSAYIAYPNMMNRNIAINSFDSAFFEERFWDFQYLGLYHVSERGLSQRNLLVFYRKSPVRKKMAFNFYGKRRYRIFRVSKITANDLYKAYPELNSFRRMTWVIDDTMSRSYYYRKFRNMVFHDIRVKYNPEDKNFTLILKTADSFIRVKAYPVYKRRNLEYAQEKYERIYSVYLKRLSGRARRFNKSIKRGKIKFKNAQKYYERMLWNQLRDNYMCLEERKMTKKEWLEYYQEIVKSEEDAIKDASVEIRLLKRALEINNYAEEVYTTSRISPSINQRYNIQITDNLNNNIPVSTFILINKTDYTYKVRRISNPLETLTLFLDNSKEYAIVSFLPNSSVSLTTTSSLFQIINNDNSIARVKSQITIKELATIGQILSTLEI